MRGRPQRQYLQRIWAQGSPLEIRSPSNERNDKPVLQAGAEGQQLETLVDAEEEVRPQCRGSIKKALHQGQGWRSALLGQARYTLDGESRVWREGSALGARWAMLDGTLCDSWRPSHAACRS